MFEYTISSSENLGIINNIYIMLSGAVKSVNGIIIKQNSLKTDSVCLAVENKHKEYIKACILDAIADAIINTYKQQYLHNNITITIKNNVAYNAFISALVVFDRQTDKDIIKKNLVLENKLHIDSFYNFRLQQLHNRWYDIVCIVNESIPIMLKDRSVAEITSYFVENTNKEIFEAHLYILENVIQIKLDDKLNDLQFNTNNSYVNDILTEIISVSPKRVIIHGEIDKHKELHQALVSVFLDKVQVAK